MSRIRKYFVDASVIRDFFQADKEWQTIKSDLPKDAEFRGIAHDSSINAIVAFFEHPSFDDVQPGWVPLCGRVERRRR